MLCSLKKPINYSKFSKFMSDNVVYIDDDISIKNQESDGIEIFLDIKINLIVWFSCIRQYPLISNIVKDLCAFLFTATFSLGFFEILFNTIKSESFFFFFLKSIVQSYLDSVKTIKKSFL